MTLREKKRRAAMIAVAYYVEQEAAKGKGQQDPMRAWRDAGKEVAMSSRRMVQRRGRSVPST